MAAALATAWRVAAAGGRRAAGLRAFGSDAPGADKWQLVSIDRSGLAGEGGIKEGGGDAGGASAGPPPVAEPTPLMKHIQALIKVNDGGARLGGLWRPATRARRANPAPPRRAPQFRGGPLTVAEYMKEALTNPHAGYYTTRDAVFGGGGDFVTAPDVSQLLGDCLAVWAVLEWRRVGSPAACRYVELGPGRGTLAADLLRAAAPVPGFASSLAIHLVEVSPSLRRAQWDALRCGPPGSTGPEAAPGEPAAGVSHLAAGAAVAWHATLDSVPPAGPPTLYMAHEFVDALPVHQFVRVVKAGGRGGRAAPVRPPSSPHPLLPNATAWRERLIDATACGTRLRWVLAPGDTPASRTLLPARLAGLGAAAATLDALEICPAGSALAADLAARVSECKGSALLIDYGRAFPPYPDSLVAIARHVGVDPLAAPGEADLSARVDFGGLRDAVAGAGVAAAAHGPITQAALLAGLGIAPRLQALVDAAPDAAAAEALHSGALRLVGPSAEGGMGEAYMALAIAPADRPAPVPFAGCGGEGGGG